MCCYTFFLFFFFNDTATTEIYTLSLHDALPILAGPDHADVVVERASRQLEERGVDLLVSNQLHPAWRAALRRSEEHTSELQSRLHLVCRLLLEKKKKTKTYMPVSQ